MRSYHRIALFHDKEFVFFDEELGRIRLNAANKKLANIWGEMFAGESFLLIEETDKDFFLANYNIFVLEVVKKSLYRNDLNRSLELYVKITRATSLPSLIHSSPLQSFQQLSRNEYKKYKNTCPVYQNDNFQQIDSNPIYLYKKDNYRCYIASSKEDDMFIRKIAENHDFGYSPCFLQFIVEYKGQKKGAIGVKFSELVEESKELDSRKKLFKKELSDIKKHSLLISRIYSDDDRSYKADEHLIKCVEQYADILVSNLNYSYLEGVSYNYHPVANLLKFNLLAPRGVTGVFYYYKRIFNHYRDEKNQEIRRQREVKWIKGILNERRKKNYWIINGKPGNLNKSFLEKSWGLKDGENIKRNVGGWNVLKSGDVVFMGDSLTQSIWGYQIVKSKRKLSVREKYGVTYPLWMSFSTSTRLDQPFTISRKYFKDDVGILSIKRSIGENWEELIIAGKSEGRVTIPIPAEEFKNSDENKTALLSEGNNCWIVHCSRAFFNKAYPLNLWALRDSKINRNLWKQIARGDQVIFCVNKNSIIGYGKVNGTEMKGDGMFKDYPLGIFLNKIFKTSYELAPFERIDYTNEKGGIQKIYKNTESFLAKIKS